MYLAIILFANSDPFRLTILIFLRIIKMMTFCKTILLCGRTLLIKVFFSLCACARPSVRTQPKNLLYLWSDFKFDCRIGWTTININTNKVITQLAGEDCTEEVSGKKIYNFFWFCDVQLIFVHFAYIFRLNFSRRPDFLLKNIYPHRHILAGIQTHTNTMVDVIGVMEHFILRFKDHILSIMHI